MALDISAAQKKYNNASQSNKDKYKKQLKKLKALSKACKNYVFARAASTATATVAPTATVSPKGYLCRAEGMVNACTGKYPYKYCHVKSLSSLGYNSDINISMAEALKECNDSVFFEMVVLNSEYMGDCEIAGCDPDYG